MSIKLAVTSFKVFTTFWSAVLVALSAATVAHINQAQATSGLGASAATLVASLTTVIYLVSSLATPLFLVEPMICSMWFEMSTMGLLNLWWFAALVALSTSFSTCTRDYCQIASATVGCGWVMWVLITTILLFEPIYALKRFGLSRATWKVSFLDLLTYGERRPDPERQESPHYTVPMAKK